MIMVKVMPWSTEDKKGTHITLSTDKRREKWRTGIIKRPYRG
jgi:hypothetical protein